MLRCSCVHTLCCLATTALGLWLSQTAPSPSWVTGLKICLAFTKKGELAHRSSAFVVTCSQFSYDILGTLARLTAGDGGGVTLGSGFPVCGESPCGPDGPDWQTPAFPAGTTATGLACFEEAVSPALPEGTSASPASEATTKQSLPGKLVCLDDAASRGATNQEEALGPS